MRVFDTASGRGAMLRCLAILGALIPVIASSQDARLAARIATVRDAAAVRPSNGLAALSALRKELGSSVDLVSRLSIDEVECRLLTDLNVGRAIAAADGGLAAAGGDPRGAARVRWLRLRACRAGMLAEQGNDAAARAEFAALDSLTAAEAEPGSRAMLLLERGVVRSRAGEYESGQDDLQRACAILAQAGPPRDSQLCQTHLSNHYRRVGDYDEALRLLQPLRAAARRAHETYDESIYAYGIAMTLEQQARWNDAVAEFREAALVNEKLGDTLGVSYCEHGVARVLLKLNRPSEALAFADRAKRHVDRATDPRHLDEVSITRATILAGLGRATEARQELAEAEASVRSRRNPPLLEQWLRADAATAATAREWRDAYEALAEAQRIEDQLSSGRRSEQAARLRAQYNRARDGSELATLRRLNEQGQQLRHMQEIALALFVILLLAAVGLVLRKMLQARRLQALASTDELTGIPNRRALVAYLEQAFAAARETGALLSVLMIDVDHFKRVNDTRGHAVGDEVLRHLARILGKGLRDADRLGRVGGEEFVIVLPETSTADARLVAERIRIAVAAQPMPHPEGDVQLTVSIGVAGAKGAPQARVVLAFADAALYRAKARGRNAVVLHDDVTVAA